MSSFGSTPQRGSSSFGVGGTTLPNVSERERDFQRSNQRNLEARRIAGNEQTVRERQARSQQRNKDFLKERKRIRGEVLRAVGQNQGRQEARLYQERLERAVKLGERIPIPEGMPVDLSTQAQLDRFREAGFDVPRRLAPAGGGGGAVGTNLGGGGSSGSGRKVGGNFPDADRDDALLTGTITKDEFARKYGSGGSRSFNQPSGRFEVDRVAQGNNVQDVIERKPQPQPRPEPEPELSLELEDDTPLIDRRKTGGASGGIQGLTTDQQFDELVSSRGQTNPFGNTGLASQRSVPTGVGSGLSEAQKQRDAQLIAQLEADKIGDSPRPDSGSGTGLGRGNPLKRAGTI